MQDQLSELTPSPAWRRIPLERAFNFRDLGGYETTSGKEIRRRRLFRSDDLFRLSDQDLAVLAELGIKTVIDLRTESEAGRGRFPADKMPVDYYQNSLIDISADHALARGDTAKDYIYLRYTQILTEGQDGIRQVFLRLMEPQSTPTVFHCVAGKDRTGLIAAITLEILGVERDQVLGDYALTNESMRAALEWLQKEFPNLAQRMTDLPPVVLSAEPANLSRVLEWLDIRFGGAEGYLAGLGVPVATMDRFRASMLE